MEFKTEAQRECYERVYGLMQELFGKFTLRRNDAPVIGLVMGSAIVEVAVQPLEKTKSMVVVRSCVATGTELRPDLLEYLLRENNRMAFGAFALDADNTIVFEHGILGEGCDQERLHRAVMAVVTTADAQDNAIVARWGGQRAVDRMRGSV